MKHKINSGKLPFYIESFEVEKSSVHISFETYTCKWLIDGIKTEYNIFEYRITSLFDLTEIEAMDLVQPIMIEKGEIIDDVTGEQLKEDMLIGFENYMKKPKHANIMHFNSAIDSLKSLIQYEYSEYDDSKNYLLIIPKQFKNGNSTT